MKYKYYFLIVATSAALFLMNPGSAQIRPDCDANPDHPGVCFSPTGERATVLCGFEGPGVLQMFNFAQPNLSFEQELPNGLSSVHAPRTTATFGFCYWEDIFTGNCFPPAEGAYVGAGSLILEGFKNDQGFGCPLRFQGSGTLFRLSDGEMLEIDLDVHTFPDDTSPSGCSTRICQLIAPE